MSVYDISGFLTGVICVWLIVRENIWNWPWGIVNSAIFCVSFFVVGLYADSALQIVYVVLGIYGWWAWLHAGPNHLALPMRRISPMLALAVGTFLVIATYAFATVLASKLGSTVPFWDALTTALSLAAQFLLTRKIIDNWYFWIAADVIYIPLYVYKHLPLTAALYVVFLGLCIAGIARWETSMRSARLEAG